MVMKAKRIHHRHKILQQETTIFEKAKHPHIADQAHHKQNPLLIPG